MTSKWQLTRHQEEQIDCNEGVAKVQQVREGTSDGSLVEEVVDREEEQVEGSSTSAEEGPPPPAIVFRAQMEVAEEYGCLGTDHYQNDEGEHHETKHVVHLARPTQIHTCMYMSWQSRLVYSIGKLLI